MRAATPGAASSTTGRCPPRRVCPSPSTSTSTAAPARTASGSSWLTGPPTSPRPVRPAAVSGTPSATPSAASSAASSGSDWMRMATSTMTAKAAETAVRRGSVHPRRPVVRSRPTSSRSRSRGRSHRILLPRLDHSARTAGGNEQAGHHARRRHRHAAGDHADCLVASGEHPGHPRALAPGHRAGPLPPRGGRRPVDHRAQRPRTGRAAQHLQVRLVRVHRRLEHVHLIRNSLVKSINLLSNLHLESRSTGPQATCHPSSPWAPSSPTSTRSPMPGWRSFRADGRR